jgi:hypothetical protein
MKFGAGSDGSQFFRVQGVTHTGPRGRVFVRGVDIGCPLATIDVGYQVLIRRMNFPTAEGPTAFEALEKSRSATIAAMASYPPSRRYKGGSVWGGSVLI